MSTDIVAPPSHHASDIAALDALAPASQGVRAVRSGAWSDAGTWGGTVPASGAVVVPAGVGVIVDAQLSSTLSSVRVDGCLEFARSQNTHLRTELLYVAPGGEIWIGSPNAPISSSVTAEVTLPPTGPFNVTRDPNMLGKGFVSASKTTVFGAEKTSRVRTAVAPMTGTTTIALASAPSGWQVGDRLVLTGTRWIRFIPDANKINQAAGAQDEELTITAINGASVSVSPALKFDHDGPTAEFMPFLVNFSRNIRFSTENASAVTNQQRMHAMFMSPQTVIRSAEFRDMGRTDKSIRAASASKFSPILPTSNIKGRYPLHLHQTGGHGSTLAADVRNVAVWKSPGWGITQHSGIALLYDNSVYDAFGSGIVAESGDEQGAWVSNIAIKSVGVAEIVKDTASVQAFDLARTGDGFWMQGRLLRLHKNVAAGMGGGNGFVFMNRASDISNPTPIMPDMMLQPVASRYTDFPTFDPNLQQFTDNEAFACKQGYHVTKTDPNQPHEARSVIDGFTAWEVELGIELTYVSSYTIKNATLIGARLRQSSLGVDFGENTYDAAVVDSRIEDFNYGVKFTHFWTTTFGPAAFYISSNNRFQNNSFANHLNADPDDTILTASPGANSTSLNFTWGSSLPVWPSPGTSFLPISGTKTDSLGSVPFPMVPDKYKITFLGISGLLQRFGYYTLADGTPAAVALEHFSNRITGEIEMASYPFTIAPTFDLSTFQNKGVLNPTAPAPTPANDSAIVQRNGSVTIAVRANDGSGGPFTVIGVIPSRNGATAINANGDIVYAPYPDYSGADSFSYWIRSSQGRIGKAKVTITVQ